MGVTKQLRAVMKEKGIKLKDFAQMYNPDSEAKTKTQVVSNMLTRDNMTFATVEQMADLLGCEVVLRDKKTGKIY